MYPDQSDRLLRLERKVDFLFQRLGIDPEQALVQDDFPAASYQPRSGGPQFPSSFDEALRRGKLIEAIKIYREVTGAGLREAKSAVEAMHREYR